MKINFNPLDLVNDETYYNSWIARIINSKLKLTLVYNYKELKFVNMQVWISELQEWEIIESYNVQDNFTITERETLYNEMFIWNISIETEAKLYAMLPFENKYIENLHF
jgi:hypothetical protein